jgi:predicted O-methyltransferase YrrM
MKQGILYMAFGDPAKADLRRSLESLRKVGCTLPVAVITDRADRWDGVIVIPWTGPSPWDPDKGYPFEFRAGRVKPHLLKHSPFDQTLYLDTDTTFLRDPTPGFELTKDADIACTHEKTRLGQLYHHAGTSWEVSMQERDATIKELNQDPQLWNSGVIFFNKNDRTRALFAGWEASWLEWKNWDEQMALMRAASRVPGLGIFKLEGIWNSMHVQENTIIHHRYGRCTSRSTMAMAVIERARQIPSWTTDKERRLICNWAATVDGQDIVEIGVLYGGSTAIIALAAPNSRITAIDNFTWSPIKGLKACPERVRANLTKVGVDGNVRIIHGNSQEVGKAWDHEVELVFIDGGHELEPVTQDLENFGTKARVIICHDYENEYWKTVRQAVDAFLKNHTNYRMTSKVDSIVVLERQP